MTSGTQSGCATESGTRVDVSASFEGSEMAGFLGSSGKYGGPRSTLQVTDEMPSDLISLVFLFGNRQSGEADSYIRGDQSSWLDWASPSRLAVCYMGSDMFRDHQRLQ